MDQAFCATAVPRARFRPATDENGTAVHGIYRNKVRFIISGTTMPREPQWGDVALMVDRLPEQVSNPAYITVRLVVTPEGKIAQCASLQGTPPETAKFLSQIACAALQDGDRLAAVRDAAGKPVKYVAERTVRFETPAGR